MKIISAINSDHSTIEIIHLINIVDRTNNHFTSLNNNRLDFKELVYKAFLNNYIFYCNSINNICIIIFKYFNLTIKNSIY